jgi:hypothetical protein
MSDQGPKDEGEGLPVLLAEGKRVIRQYAVSLRTPHFTKEEHEAGGGVAQSEQVDDLLLIELRSGAKVMLRVEKVREPSLGRAVCPDNHEEFLPVARLKPEDLPAWLTRQCSPPRAFTTVTFEVEEKKP